MMTTMRKYLFLLAVLVLCIGCSCNKSENPGIDGQALQTSASGTQNNDFAFQLYQEADRSGDNLFFSPYSISSALSMVHAGAKGKTAEGIARAMKFNAPDETRHASFGTMQAELNALGEEGRAEMNVANALFGSDANSGLLREDFLDLLRENYSSELFSLDFSDPAGTADFINDWVQEQTRDRIKKLISPSHISDSNNGLVLANAIYFKGNWFKMFDPERTRRDYFYISSQDRTPDAARPVEMMSTQDTFAYAEFADCQVLELPYAEEDLAMLIILPREIDQLRSALSQDALLKWQENLNHQEVQVYIPKFKFELTFEGLADLLRAMGMEEAFDPNQADFSGMMDPDPGLYLMDVVHKAFIEVNEEGTEAAAATGAVMAVTSVGPNEPAVPVFRADKPFVYMILHKPSNSILFLGKLNIPPER